MPEARPNRRVVLTPEVRFRPTERAVFPAYLRRSFQPGMTPKRIRSARDATSLCNPLERGLTGWSAVGRGVVVFGVLPQRRSVEDEDFGGVVVVGVVVAHEGEDFAARQELDAADEVVAHGGLELAADRDDEVGLAFAGEAALGLGHVVLGHADDRVVADGGAGLGGAAAGVLGDEADDQPADVGVEGAGCPFGVWFVRGHYGPPFRSPSVGGEPSASQRETREPHGRLFEG